MLRTARRLINAIAPMPVRRAIWYLTDGSYRNQQRDFYHRIRQLRDLQNRAGLAK